MADLKKKIDNELKGCKRNENENLSLSFVHLSKIKLYSMISFYWDNLFGNTMLDSKHDKYYAIST